MDDEKQIDPRAAKAKEEDRRRKRRRVRALIIGSLAAGGAFQLNGWMAQAHGNRSTKSMVGEFPDIVSTPEVKEKIEKERIEKERIEREKRQRGGAPITPAKP